ncbi:hypothetical protein D3C76_1238780 [compost metagenome]
MPAPETSRPFQAPSTSERPIARTTDIRIKPSAFWSGPLLMLRQATAPEMATMEPTDKSMPLVATTSVIPIATRISGDPKLRISIRLPYKCPSCIVMEKKSGE